MQGSPQCLEMLKCVFGRCLRLEIPVCLTVHLSDTCPSIACPLTIRNASLQVEQNLIFLFSVWMKFSLP